jgi:hypothetical protein
MKSPFLTLRCLLKNARPQLRAFTRPANSGVGLHRSLILLTVLQLWSCGAVFAQNINVIVPPGGTVDIHNTTAGRWYFSTAPSSGGATMSRVSSNLVAVYTWPDLANFAPDPTNHVRNRLFPGEYLRVFAGTLPGGSVITIPYNTPNPLSNNYTITVSVVVAASVTSINIIDPSPTAAASVRWGVTFSEAVAGVTAANFTLTNPNGLSGATITGVSGSGTDWIVTASTGTGTGLLGCSYVGHVSETPPVPATFTGQQYTFSEFPLVTQEPVGAGPLPTGSSHTMTAAGIVRGGGGVTYQWYRGTSTNPGAATLINGATSASYSATNLAAGNHQYFCRIISVANTSFKTDSVTATVIVYGPLNYWRFVHGLPLDGLQDLANPSGDGVANLLKFAFNLAPNVGDLAVPNTRVLPDNGTAGLPNISRNAQGRLVIQFIRRKAATIPSVAYVAVSGDDLAAMQPVNLTGATVMSIDASWERVSVTDQAITPKRFGCVRVSVVP